MTVVRVVTVVTVMTVVTVVRVVTVMTVATVVTAELFPVWKMLRILGAFLEQKCPQIGISQEFRRFSGAFWGRFQSCHGSFVDLGAFWKLF